MGGTGENPDDPEPIRSWEGPWIGSSSPDFPLLDLLRDKNDVTDAKVGTAEVNCSIFFNFPASESRLNFPVAAVFSMSGSGGGC